MSQTDNLSDVPQATVLQVECAQVSETLEGSWQTFQLAVLKQQFCQVDHLLQVCEHHKLIALIVDL